MMAMVTPTIHFNGQCQEAIELYQKAFDARIGCILHYTDSIKSDWDYEIPPEQEAYVYHSEIYIGDNRIMMGDNSVPDPNKSTSNFLTVTFDTAEEVRRAYEALKEGGRIITPIEITTYSSCMASLVDRFGVRWGIMTEGTDK